MSVRFYSSNRQIQLKKSKQGDFSNLSNRLKGGQDRRHSGRFKLPSSNDFLGGGSSRSVGLGMGRGVAKANNFRFNTVRHYLLRRPTSRFMRFKNKRNLYKCLLSGGLQVVPVSRIRGLQEAQRQQVVASLKRGSGLLTSYQRRIALRRSLARSLSVLEHGPLGRLERTEAASAAFYARIVLPQVGLRKLYLRQFTYLGLANLSLLSVLSKKGFGYYSRARYTRLNKEVRFGRLWGYLYSTLLGSREVRTLLGKCPMGGEKGLRNNMWRAMLLQAVLYRAGRQLGFVLRGRTVPSPTAKLLTSSLRGHYIHSVLRSWKARIRRWNTLRADRGAAPTLDKLDRLQFRTILPAPVLPIRRKHTVFSRRRFSRILSNVLTASDRIPSSFDFRTFLPKRRYRRKKVRTEATASLEKPLLSLPKRARSRRHHGGGSHPVRRRDIRKEFQAFMRRSPGRLVLRDGQWVLRIKRRGGRVDYRPLKLHDLRPNSVWRTRVGGGRKKWVYKSIKRNRLWNYLTRTRTPYDSVMLRARDFKRTKRIFSYLQWKFGYSRSLRKKKALSRRASMSHTRPGSQLAFYALLRDPQNNFSIVQNRGHGTLLNYLALSMGNNPYYTGSKKGGKGFQRWSFRRLGAWSLNRIYFINDTIGVTPKIHRTVGSPFIRPSRVTHFAGSNINPFKPHISVIDPIDFDETSKFRGHPSVTALAQLGVYHNMSSRFKSPYLAAVLKPRFRELLAMKQVQYGKTR